MDISDAVDDQAAGADILGRHLAVDAVAQRAAGPCRQCCPGPDRGLTTQFFGEPGAQRRLVGDGVGRIRHRRLAPVVVPRPRHRLLADLKPKRRYAPVVEQEGGEAVTDAVVEFVHEDQRERRARHTLVARLGPNSTGRHDQGLRRADDAADHRHQVLAVSENVDRDRRRRRGQAPASLVAARHRRGRDREGAAQCMSRRGRRAQRHEVVVVNRSIAGGAGREELGGA
jgi:hypothetical protein